MEQNTKKLLKSVSLIPIILTAPCQAIKPSSPIGSIRPIPHSSFALPIAKCQLFFLNSALSTSKIILLPLMPNSQNSYGLLILDFKEGNISGITECNKQFT